MTKSLEQIQEETLKKLLEQKEAMEKSARMSIRSYEVSAFLEHASKLSSDIVKLRS